ncbi:MAG: TIGR00730 family Rossman fold protein [Anaerolineales bacterium]|nr:TIGR00730 family Rossman fold protein [Anaerolineales bacterium]
MCIYGGSSDTISPVYTEAAAELGHLLAREGTGIVFGGGKTGMMGAIADAMRAEGAEVIGIIPELFNTPELGHQGLTKLIVVDTMHTRKAQMAEMADAFVALPGGFGTYEELFEILTWSQIGLHTKPIGVLNVQGYYDPLLDLIEHSRQHGFVYDEHRTLLMSGKNAAELLEKLKTYRTPDGLDRWVHRKGPQAGSEH